ncbi:MAG: amidase domain-containing protein [Oscillospiraceae bacterium]|nr:amidase domain-containing protein [Oscillospiraceae bacterium]
MKKLISLTLILSIVLALTASAFAVYDNGPQNTNYNRTNAKNYIYNYTITPNNTYADFTKYGGDCTNFVSQVVHAGGMPMTSPVNNPGDDSWYYYGSDWGTGRTSSWTKATNFRKYWADINGDGGKHAYQFKVYLASDFKNDSIWSDVWSYLEPGDIVQYVSTSDWATYHSQAVHRTSYENGEFKVSMGQHTANSWQNLRNYVTGLSDKNTRVCLIKISANTFNAKSIQNMPEISSMSIDELAAEESRLNDTKPKTMEEEHEKWAAIALVKQELVKRAKESKISYKAAITMDALQQFMINRMENNQLFITCAENIEDKSIKASLITECKEARAENERISEFMKNMQNKRDVHDLWNEYWNDIIHQAPPSYYE